MILRTMNSTGPVSRQPYLYLLFQGLREAAGLPSSLFHGLPAHFPDDTGGPVATVELRVGAGTTGCEAFLAVAPFMLAAINQDIPVGMKTADLLLDHRLIPHCWTGLSSAGTPLATQSEVIGFSTMDAQLMREP